MQLEIIKWNKLDPERLTLWFLSHMEPEFKMIHICVYKSLLQVLLLIIMKYNKLGIP